MYSASSLGPQYLSLWFLSHVILFSVTPLRDVLIWISTAQSESLKYYQNRPGPTFPIAPPSAPTAASGINKTRPLTTNFLIGRFSLPLIGCLRIPNYARTEQIYQAKKQNTATVNVYLIVHRCFKHETSTPLLWRYRFF